MTDNHDEPAQEKPEMIDEPEVAHGHHGRSGIAWLDVALSVSVLALSGASLFTAQHTGHTMERLVEENSRLVRANATPVLQFSTGNVYQGERNITLSVSNVGTGTARVIWFELRRDNRPITGVTQLIGYQPRAAERDYVMTRPVADTYIPAGEERLLMALKYPNYSPDASHWNALDAGKGQLRATACFCSVLGECWTSHLDAELPVSVPVCEPRERTSFRG